MGCVEPLGSELFSPVYPPQSSEELVWVFLNCCHLLKFQPCIPLLAQGWTVGWSADRFWEVGGHRSEGGRGPKAQLNTGLIKGRTRFWLATALTIWVIWQRVARKVWLGAGVSAGDQRWIKCSEHKGQNNLKPCLVILFGIMKGCPGNWGRETKESSSVSKGLEVCYMSVRAVAPPLQTTSFVFFPPMPSRCWQLWPELQSKAPLGVFRFSSRRLSLHHVTKLSASHCVYYLSLDEDGLKRHLQWSEENNCVITAARLLAAELPLFTSDEQLKEPLSWIFPLLYIWVGSPQNISGASHRVRDLRINMNK